MKIQGESIVLDAMNIRGFFITDTIAIERLIDDYIARYFCKTRKVQKELLELFLSTERIPFDMKRQAFKILTKKKHPDFEKTYKDFFPFLANIMEQRNIFAHYLLDMTKEGLKRYPDEIGFIKYKNETTTIWYNNKQLLEHVKKHTYCLNIIIEALAG